MAGMSSISSPVIADCRLQTADWKTGTWVLSHRLSFNLQSAIRNPQSRSELPLPHSRPPGQARAEAGEQHAIALADAVVGQRLVQGDGHASRRGVAVAIQVGEHQPARDA